MLKKMRWRFVAASMGAFAGVILLLMCVVNLWIYKTTTKQQDMTLDQLANQYNGQISFSEPKPPDLSGRFSPEVQYMVRFFSVSFDENGEVREINQDFIASVSEEEAVEKAEMLLKSGKERGYESGYRYLVCSLGEEKIVIFLNSERELQTINSVLLITAIIAVVSLLVVFLLILLFSQRAIAPYAKNLESQKQFITNASHELKTPLTAISASADVLAMEQENNEWVKSIQTQVGKLSKLIGSLVTLSRLDEENPFPNKSEFSVSEVLWEISEGFDSMARAKNKTFEKNIEDGLTVVGDRELTGQVVTILLDNAVKYSPEGATISLTASGRGRRTEIEVANTVEKDFKIDTSRLFERFYRGDESHSDKVKGSGIGLSIAKSAVQAQGGVISAFIRDDKIIFKIEL